MTFEEVVSDSIKSGNVTEGGCIDSGEAFEYTGGSLSYNEEWYVKEQKVRGIIANIISMPKDAPLHNEYWNGYAAALSLLIEELGLE